MVEYPDADVRNADWIKPAFWDTQIGPAEIRVMPLADLEHLMTLPAWEAAPQAVRAVAAERLAAVADE